MVKEIANKILKEIEHVFEISDFSNIGEMINMIVNSNKIVCAGAGRVGFAIRGFSMRLKHLGKDAYMIGDSNVPAIAGGDLLIAASGSGETQTIYDLVEIAKRNQSKIILVTGNKESRMAKIADTIIILKAPSKVKSIEEFSSIQPMTTLNEQSLGIFFDSVVLKLMDKMEESHETMWKRHSNLE